MTDSKFKFIALMGALALVGAGCGAAAPAADTPADDAMMEDSAMPADDAVMEDDAMMEDEAMEDETMETEGMMVPGEEGSDMEVTEDDGAMMEAPDHVFQISGKNFEFDVKELRVKEGDVVKIEFTAASGFHDWVVDEFGAATEQVRDGGKSEVTFVADKSGSFEYYCSVGRHRQLGMTGTLIVE